MFQLVYLGVFAAGFSLMARKFGFSLLHYWALPLGVILPWLFPLVAVLIAASRQTDSSQRQGIVMLGMFPGIALLFLIPLSSLIGLWLLRTASLQKRLFCGLGVSTVGLLLFGVLFYFQLKSMEH